MGAHLAKKKKINKFNSQDKNLANLLSQAKSNPVSTMDINSLLTSDEKSLKIYFAQNIMADMTDEQRKEWYEFLRNLRQFARRNLMSFDTRDINKSNLDIRDIKQQAKTDDTFSSNEVTVTESKMYGKPGRPYNSFATVGNITVSVKHKDKVDETVRGSRSRHVESIFLENDIKNIKFESVINQYETVFIEKGSVLNITGENSELFIATSN